MVRGEQNIRSAEREGDVVRGVAGGVNSFECVTLAFDDLTVGKPVVGREVAVAAGIERRHFAEMQRAGGAMRSFGEGFCAGRPPDRGGRRRVIAMCMRNQYLCDGFITECREDCFDMAGIGRAGVDDRYRAFADDVGIGALEGEGAWIVAKYPAHAGRYFLGDARFGFKIAVELDFLAHFPLPSNYARSQAHSLS